MTDKETMKCMWCKSNLTTDNIIISDNAWAYCKKCKRPMLDMLIQPPEHFLKQHEKEIEHDNHIHLMLKGFM